MIQDIDLTKLDFETSINFIEKNYPIQKSILGNDNDKILTRLLSNFYTWKRYYEADINAFNSFKWNNRIPFISASRKNEINKQLKESKGKLKKIVKSLNIQLKKYK